MPDPWTIEIRHRDQTNLHFLDMDGMTDCGFRYREPPYAISRACLKAAKAARQPKEERHRWGGPSGEIGGTRWTWRIEEGV